MIIVYPLKRLIVTVLAVLLVTSCSTGMEKSHSPRRTVPVAKYDLEGDEFFGGFTAAKLRTVDPCPLLHGTNLLRYGVPITEEFGGDLGSCSILMTDHGGELLHVAVAMDYPAYLEAENRISGLPALIWSDSDGCDAHVVYQGGGAEDTPRTVRVRVESQERPETCSPAVQITTEVVEQLRADPPIAARSPDELTGIDPCVLLDPLAGQDPQVGVTAKPEPRGIYGCGWELPSGVRVDVSFDDGSKDPSGLPVDIGGKPASVIPDSPDASCQIEWEHRQPPDESKFATEKVVVVATNHNPTQIDPCASAVGFAQQVKAKLPPT
ncbi:hypothetical protein AB0I53_45430 [Saccharopolyspora sp. NPDC050389]|uniref:hypothetical protein n=1 Tax=Saccharopolyspora sp. NPDC050389 TaxID=3155516 RepID=UPI0033EC44D5